MKLVWNSKPPVEEDEAKPRIILPSFPSNSLTEEFKTSWEDEDQTGEITEEIPSFVLKIDLHQLQQIADPFNDQEYLSITEINLYEQQDGFTKFAEKYKNNIIERPETTHTSITHTQQTTIAEKADATKKILDNSKLQKRFEEHQKELQHLAVFCLSLCTFSVLPYTSPALADYRPWIQGDQTPLIGLWSGESIMTEDATGALVAISSEEIEETDNIYTEASTDIDSSVDNLPQDMQSNMVSVVMENATNIAQAYEEDFVGPIWTPPAKKYISTKSSATDSSRSPALFTPLSVPRGALDAYFARLHAIENGKQDVARALVWGDSTISNDGIIKDVRSRMQGHFGDAGPGFLPVKVDQRWAFRRDIVRKNSGSWDAKNIVLGGAKDSRYGLAGSVGIAKPGAQVTLGGVEIEKKRQDIHRFQVFYQTHDTGGDLQLSTPSTSITLHTHSESVQDAYYDLQVPTGDPYVYLESVKGNVTIYGVALETNNAGVTWETFGVAGSSINSMQKQHDSHIAGQIAARDPALIVYWTGGNELGYPSVRTQKGTSYSNYYRKIVRDLRAGAPNASCLLIGPLDQGTRVNGAIVSKETLDNVIYFQQQVALEEGCAYWDARAAMGGANSFGAWLQHDPPLASPDLAHLTNKGRKKIGDTLGDVIMAEYENWKNPQGNLSQMVPSSPTKAVSVMNVADN